LAIRGARAANHECRDADRKRARIKKTKVQRGRTAEILNF
jgi:hypothetical protein